MCGGGPAEDVKARDLGTGVVRDEQGLGSERERRTLHVEERLLEDAIRVTAYEFVRHHANWCGRFTRWRKKLEVGQRYRMEITLADPHYC